MNTQNWTRENLAWLAGFYEGEGCLYVGYRKTRDRLGEPLYHFDITNTDKDVLDKVLDIVGIGKITNVGRNEEHHKDRFRFRLFKAEDIYAICVAMYPWLGQRRKAKIEEFIKLYKELDIQSRYEYQENAKCSNCDEKLEKRKKARGYCNTCYMNWYRHGDPSHGSKRIRLQKINEDMPEILSYDGLKNCKVCKKDLSSGKRARGMCHTCYVRWRRSKKKDAIHYDR